jgi:hypothetical protein
MLGTMFALIGRALHLNCAVLDLNLHVGVELLRQCALWAGHLHQVALVHRHGHLCWHRDRRFAYT